MINIVDDCQVFLFLFKCLFYTWLSTRSKSVRQPVHLPHDLFPGFIHLKEHLGLCRQLPLNIWSIKNTFQVQPVSLAVQPLFLGGKYGHGQILTPNQKHSATLKIIMWEAHCIFFLLGASYGSVKMKIFIGFKIYLTPISTPFLLNSYNESSVWLLRWTQRRIKIPKGDIWGWGMLI